jgi:hypothetical protein
LARRDRKWLLNDGRIQNPSTHLGSCRYLTLHRGVLDLSIIQWPFSITKCLTLVSRFATFSSLLVRFASKTRGPPAPSTGSCTAISNRGRLCAYWVKRNWRRSRGATPSVALSLGDSHPQVPDRGVDPVRCVPAAHPPLHPCRLQKEAYFPVGVIGVGAVASIDSKGLISPQ